ncbi:MAG TPA: hypothetical protein PLC48_08120 [Ferruginibacter sp.]|nr:hypothetical protein [Ferruginibacter sp.]
MVHELLNNILKHAKATRAVIQLNKVDENIVLILSDNGKGYYMNKMTKDVGIRNVTGRAELFNGYVKINSKPHDGHELTITLPFLT